MHKKTALRSGFPCGRALVEFQSQRTVIALAKDAERDIARKLAG